MFATWFTQDSVDASVAVIGLTGFCFAVSQWVPFSLLAEEILGGNANGSGGGADADGGGGEYEAVPGAEGVEEGEGEEIPLRGGAVRLEEGQDGHTPVSRGVVFDSGDANEEGADERTLVDENEHEREHGDGDHEGLMRDLEHSEFASDSPHAAAGHSHRGTQGETGSSGSIGEKAGIILVRTSFQSRSLTMLTTIQGNPQRRHRYPTIPRDWIIIHHIRFLRGWCIRCTPGSRTRRRRRRRGG
jgi:hypothetical protein